MLYLYLAVYLIILFGVVFYVRKKENEEDFLISGRNRSTYQILLSKFAATTGVSWFITYTAFAYEFGLGLIAAIIGFVLSFVLFAWLAIPRFYKRGREEKLYTQGDLVTSVTGSRLGRHMTDWISICAQFMGLMVAIIGGGKIISHFGLISYEWAVLITGVVVLAYLLVAGFRAVVVTDVIQGIVILGLLLFVTIGVLQGTDLQTVFSADTAPITFGTAFGFIFFGIFSFFALADRYQLTFAAKDQSSAVKGMGYASVPMVAVLFLLLAIGLGALVSGSLDNNENIKIGALLCQTGSCAEWGENSLSGINLAIEEINSEGGILGKKVELISQDSNESNPVETVTGYHNIVAQNIKYIIGPTWTAGGNSVYPVAKDGDVIVTSPSLGVADFNEAGDNLFNVWPHDELATRELAKFTIEKGLKKAAVFSSKETWYKAQGDAFIDEFTKLGGEILILDESPSSIKDVKTVAAKLLATNPDVVMYSHFDAQGIMAKELRLKGYLGEQVAILMDDTRVEQANGALENAYFVQYELATDDFQKSYEAKYSKKPGVTADNAYDAVYLYKKAIEDAGTTDVNKVKEVMNSYETFSGASGELKFDGKGGVTKPPVFWQVKAERFVKIEM